MTEQEAADPEITAQRIICAFLEDGAPEGWQRIDLAARMLVNVHESEIFYTVEDGTTVPGPVDNPALCDLLHRYRTTGYEGVDRGTWFSLRMYLRPGEDPWVSQDNDIEPRWRSPVAEVEYHRDNEHFPCTDPAAWLYTILSAQEQ